MAATVFALIIHEDVALFELQNAREIDFFLDEFRGCTKWENVFRMHLHHDAVTKFVSERQCQLWSQLFRRFCDGETNQKREHCPVVWTSRSFHAFHLWAANKNFPRSRKVRPPWKLISFHAAPLLLSCLKLLIFVFCSHRALMWKKDFCETVCDAGKFHIQRSDF